MTSTVAAAPTLPSARGPLSADVLARLRLEPVAAASVPSDLDPFGDDLQLALYLCYELHYRGFAGVADDLEWDPALLARRRDLERVFHDGLLAAVPVPGEDPYVELEAELAALRRPPGPAGVSGTLLRDVRPDRLREVLMHRSLYHLKEADPQAWALPRLEGAAKALVAAVEFDEYGGGVPERMHSALYAELMRAFDLDPTYGAYLESVPAPMLAIVNLMSMCGLHRAMRGSLLGQLAVVEITSPLGSQRMAEVVRRCGGGPAAERFYTEHAVADAVHERVMREALAEFCLDPAATARVLFGVRATVLLEDRLEAHLLGRWADEQSSLLSDPG